MQPQQPQYKLRYMQCMVKGHEGQKVNLICLDPKCHSNSLLCSFCQIQTHKTHKTKPLKYYLDELYQKYRIQGNSCYQEQMEQLQHRKDVMLVRLKGVVEDVAGKIRVLEEKIIGQYQEIKNYLQEQKRQHFEQLYLSLIRQNYGDPYFQIKNYLLFDCIPTLNCQNIFQPLKLKCLQQIDRIIPHIRIVGESRVIEAKQLKEGKDTSFVGGIDQALFLLGGQFVVNGNQIGRKHVSSHQLTFFTTKVIFKETSGKLSIKLQKFPKGQTFYFGMLSQTSLPATLHKFNESTFDTFMTSTGNIKNGYNNIGQLHQGDIIDIVTKKNQIRIKKSKLFKAQLAYHTKNRLLFIGFTGATKILVANSYKM